jgi:hypothetical protein
MQVFWVLRINPPARQSGQKSGRLLRHKIQRRKLSWQVHYDWWEHSSFGREGFFEMYRPMKPTKWGFQMYHVAKYDPDYVSLFLCYYGKPTTKNLIWPVLIFSV